MTLWLNQKSVIYYETLWHTTNLYDILPISMTYYQSLWHITNLYDIQPNSMKFYKAIITLLGEKLGKVTKIFKKWRKSEICAAAAAAGGGGSGL